MPLSIAGGGNRHQSHTCHQESLSWAGAKLQTAGGCQKGQQIRQGANNPTLPKALEACIAQQSSGSGKYPAADSGNTYSRLDGTVNMMPELLPVSDHVSICSAKGLPPALSF